MGAYSLSDRVNDGPITTTRAMHHLIKVMTSASITAIAIVVLGVDHVLLAGVIGGPAYYVGLKLWEQLVPPSRFAWTVSAWGDRLSDGACACVSLAGAYLAVRDWWHGGVLLVGCVVVWTVCHKEARP